MVSVLANSAVPHPGLRADLSYRTKSKDLSENSATNLPYSREQAPGSWGWEGILTKKSTYLFLPKITPRAHFRVVSRAALWMGGRVGPNMNARPTALTTGADKRPWEGTGIPHHLAMMRNQGIGHPP